MILYLKKYLSIYNPEINNIKVIYGPNREGDIPHSHASINKAIVNLKYKPHFSLKDGLKEAINWYWKNL